MPRTHWYFLLPAQDHGHIKKLLFWFQSRFTLSGRILLLTLTVGLSTAAPGLDLIAFVLPCVVFALLLSAWLFSYGHRPQLTLHRVITAPVTAGSYWIYHVVVKNTGPTPAYHINVHEDTLPFGIYTDLYHPSCQNTIETLLPGEEQRVTLVMRCPRRGVYALPNLLYGSDFPSGLVTLPRRANIKQQLVVLPKMADESLSHAITQATLPNIGTTSNRPGNSMEFLSTREFRHGEPIRHIHWTSYARTGRLIVKEYAHEKIAQVGIILDAEYHYWDRIYSLEHAISLIGNVTQEYMKQGAMVDIFALGRELYQQQHFESNTYFAAGVWSFLSQIEDANRVKFNTMIKQISPQLNKLSHVTVFLKKWDRRRHQLCALLNETGILMDVYVADAASIPSQSAFHIRPLPGPIPKISKSSRVES